MWLFIIIHANIRTYFSFNCHRYFRSLHSFPTRRSSDLLAGRIPGALDQEFAGGRGGGLALGGGVQRGRSEEHTSELQSRGHLVCRLLLEKKKINIEYTSLFPEKNNIDSHKRVLQRLRLL